MKIGYARISTLDQNLYLQEDALKNAGCEKIVTDTASGKQSERPGLTKLRELLRKGDVLVVWRLDRLGRSLKDLVQWVAELEEQGIGFQSLQESIDTTSPSGKLVFHLFASLAEFERNLIRERTMAGLAAARTRGKQGGRRKKLDAKQRQLAITLHQQRQHTIKEICLMLGISKQTLYTYVNEAKRNGTLEPWV